MKYEVFLANLEAGKYKTSAIVNTRSKIREALEKEVLSQAEIKERFHLTDDQVKVAYKSLRHIDRINIRFALDGNERLYYIDKQTPLPKAKPKRKLNL